MSEPRRPADECRQVWDLLDSYLSDELLVETNVTVERHLGECGRCATEFERRRRLRVVLRQALAVDVDATDVTQRIRTSIERRRGWRGLLRSPAFAAAVAASVTIAAGVAWVAWRAELARQDTAAVIPGTRLVDATVYEDVTRSHVLCALGQKFPMRPTDDQIRQRLGPYANVVRALRLDTAGYQLLDAHVCPNGDRRFGHLVLRRGDDIVSIFIAPRNRGDLPDTRVVWDTGDTPMHVAEREGFELAGLETRRHVGFVVTDLRDGAHEKTSRTLGVRLAGFLRTEEGPLDR